MDQNRARTLLLAERNRVEQLISETVTDAEQDRDAANEPVT